MLALAAVLAAPRPGAADPSYNWPQWRGPAGQGISREKDLPAEWSATENVAWKTPIPGRGHSSPIVWGDRIFLTTAVEGDPTPVTDGGAVYAYFGAEGLYAYDFGGTLLWKADLGGIATMGVGVGTSPVLYRDLVILQCDEDNGDKSFITALEKKTGKPVWRVPRKVQVSWATPIIVRAGGRDELVTSGTEAVIAYDPATGKERWRSKGLDSNAVPSPVGGPDVVVLSAGYPAKVAVGIRPGGSGEITGTPRVLWTYNKGTAYVPSPILYEGHVYLMTDRGLVTCLDARTGEVKYEGARPPAAATFMASPVAFEGKVLLFSEDGDTVVLKAGPKHEVLRSNPLGEPIQASPAISRGRLFIRGAHLYCIRRARLPS